MAVREAIGARMVAEVLEPQRARVLDQQPEDAPPPRQVPDRTMGLCVHAGRDEALELPAAVVEHADGRVARAGDLAGNVEELLEDGINVQLRDQRSPGVDQTTKAELVEDRLGHGDTDDLKE